MRNIRTTFLVLVLCNLTSGATAQVLPSEPIIIGDGRAVIGGDVAASIAPIDTGYFNFSDYDHTTLREIRLGLTASVRATDHIAILGELRSENFERVTPFALYARIHPWRERRLDVQIGRIPPTFGAFTRNAYGHDNPLIGYPLAYQYLTSVRPDSAPANVDELLRMRGRGWRSSFGIGNRTPDHGLPLVTAFSWDTGIQVTTGWRAVDVTAAVTNGSASNPRVSDDNDGKQFATRVKVIPATGLVIGTSFARGQYANRQLIDAEPGTADRFVQHAYGIDLEYSRNHWIGRADAVLSQWDVPAVASPLLDVPLRALALRVEGRYTIFPGAYAAARAEHLAFNHVRGTSRVDEWEAPVSRLEVGGGYYLQRNVVARVSVQMNWRDGGRVRRLALPAAQLLFWF
jgi:hypothetical protein